MAQEGWICPRCGKVKNANCKKTFAFLDEYVPPPTRKERRKRERELKKKFPIDFTKFIESHRT